MRWNANLKSVVTSTPDGKESYGYQQSIVMEKDDVIALRCVVHIEGMFTDEWFKVSKGDEGHFAVPANMYFL